MAAVSHLCSSASSPEVDLIGATPWLLWLAGSLAPCTLHSEIQAFGEATVWNVAGHCGGVKKIPWWLSH